MSASNHRVKDYETVHHLMSRIAHSVFFMKDDERTDFLSLAFRAADFCGLKLLGWCIMTNHFHLLVYLPQPETLTDEEVRARYAVLVGPERAEEADVGALRRRMFDVGEYMKIVKQSFTEGYNRREVHSGTMWEAVYRDKVVPRRTKDLSDSLCYQHLNPIRAAITPIFTAYPWSSLAVFVQGDAEPNGACPRCSSLIFHFSFPDLWYPLRVRQGQGVSCRGRATERKR